MIRNVYLKLLIFIICGFMTLVILKDPYVNMIYPYELSKTEKEILNLAGVNNSFSNHFNVYDFIVDDNYKRVSVWLETYKNGELIASTSVGDVEFDSKKGRIAVNVDTTSNYEWRISLQSNDSLSSFSFLTDGVIETNEDLIMGSSYFSEEVRIAPEKEIVLKTFLFVDGNGMPIVDPQHYVNDPDILKEYDYVYLLKCKFSEKTISEIYDN